MKRTVLRALMIAFGICGSLIVPATSSAGYTCSRVAYCDVCPSLVWQIVNPDGSTEERLTGSCCTCT